MSVKTRSLRLRVAAWASACVMLIAAVAGMAGGPATAGGRAMSPDSLVALTVVATPNSVTAGVETQVSLRYEITNLSQTKHLYWKTASDDAAAVTTLVDDVCGTVAGPGVATPAGEGWTLSAARGLYTIAPGGTAQLDCATTVTRDEPVTATATLTNLVAGLEDDPAGDVATQAVSATETLSLADVAAPIASAAPEAMPAATTAEDAPNDPMLAAAPRAMAPLAAAAALATGGSGGPVNSNATPNSRAYTFTKTASRYTVPAGGGAAATVTYTYTVTNNNPGRASDRVQRIYYVAMEDDKCSPVGNPTGAIYQDGAGHSYIPAGGTATFTCTVVVTADVTNTATANFQDYYYNQMKATATATVVVEAGGGAAGSCDVLWYSAGASTVYGNLGTVNATGDTVTNDFQIRFEDTSATTEYDSGTSGMMTGSAAVAVDPVNSNYIYYIPRNTNRGSYGGLWRYNAADGTNTRVANSNVTPDTVRLAVAPDGSVWALGTTGTLRRWTQATGWVDKGGVRLTNGYTFVSGRTNSLGSGDLVFDGRGGVYIIGSNSGGTAFLYGLAAADLANATSGSNVTATTIGSMGKGWFNGLAFDTRGTLYATTVSNTGAATGALWTVNIATGTATKVRDLAVGTEDLGSCALPKSELSVQKTVDPATHVPRGGTLTYTITVRNLGTLAATGVTFEDVPRADTPYVTGSTTLNGQSVPDGANGTFPYRTAQSIKSTLAESDGVIAAGDVATITFQVRVPQNYSQTTVCNQASVTFLGSAVILSDDPNVPGSADRTCLDIEKPAVGIDKNSQTTHVDAVNNSVTYTYAVTTNANLLFHSTPGSTVETPVSGRTIGTEPLTNIVVTDDKCSPVAHEFGPDGVHNSGDRNSDGKLQPGEIWQFTCTTTLTQTTTNTAVVTGRGETSGTAVTDSDTWTVTLKPSSINAAKSAGTVTGPAADGSFTATYNVTVTNTGSGAGYYGPITDTLAFDPALTPRTATWAKQGTPVVTGPLTTFTDAPYTFEVGTATTALSAGATDTYTVTVTFARTSPGVITDCQGAGAGLFNSIAMPGDTVPDDNTACNSFADFAVAKTAAFPAPQPTDNTVGITVKVNTDGTATLSYVVTVTNHGNAAGKHPALTDTLALPAGFTLTGLTYTPHGASAVALTPPTNPFTIPASTTDVAVGEQVGYKVDVSLNAADLSAVVWDDAGTCSTENNGDPTKGAFNRVTMPADADGEANNEACVPLERPTTNVTIAKVGFNCDTDQASCALAGAEFAVYDHDPSGAPGAALSIGQATGGVHGNTFTAANIAFPGTYWLVETKAPAGHQLLADAVQFSIEPSGTITLAAGATTAITVSGSVATNDLLISIPDPTQPVLPKVGGLGYWPHVIAGLALVLLALGYHQTLNPSPQVQGDR